MTSDYVKQYAEVVRPFGTIVSITMDESLNIKPIFTISARLVLEMMFTRPLFGVEPEITGKILARVAKLIDQKVLVSTVTDTLTFNVKNLEEVHKRQHSGVVYGKITLDKVDEL